MVKQVIVMRKDLNMRKGKMIAQGAHASLAAVLNQGQYYISVDEPHRLDIPLEGPLQEWLEDKFTKICVYVESESELIEVYEEAKKAGLICAMIRDAGLTEFGGVPTLTCCAIGPANKEDVDKITGHLKLL